MEKDLELSDITATDIQHKTIGSIFIEDYRKEVSKRLKNDISVDNLAGYSSSIFQDFESYPRTEVDSAQDVLEWFQRSLIQVLSPMNYYPVVTLLKTFPLSF